MSDEQQDQVTPEAYQRVLQERDDARAQLKEAEGQVSAARKVSQVERFLRTQKIPEEEIPGRVDLLGPHLAEIPLDKLTETLSSDRFKPLVAAPAPVASGDGEGGEEAEEPVIPPVTPPGGFNIPSPAADGAPPQQKKYTSREIQRMVINREIDDAQLQKLYKDDLVLPPSRNY